MMFNKQGNNKGVQVGEIAKRIEQANNYDFVTAVPVWIDASEFDFKAHFGLRSLSSLSKTHMTRAQRDEIDEVFKYLAEWRERIDSVPDASFGLLGNPGIGKTHIAKCAGDSIHTFLHSDIIDANDPDVSMIKHCVFYTANEILQLLADDEFKIGKRTKLIIVDDIGRERSVKYEKRDFETQTQAKQQLYFELIDMCVGRCGLFLTSNLTGEQFKAFFNDATYDRLLAMFAPGHLYEMTKVETYRPYISGRKEI